MGARHNRKRIRSRPRNRTLTKQARSFFGFPTSQALSTIASFPTPRFVVHPQQQQQDMIWEDQNREQHQGLISREHHEATAAAEAQRLLIFGGEEGDEVSLCAPMLQVVMGLFNGRLDYEDP